MVEEAEENIKHERQSPALTLSSCLSRSLADMDIDTVLCQMERWQKCTEKLPTRDERQFVRSEYKLF